METEENKKKRFEKLGEYFLNLSNTVLGSSVLGALAMLIVEQQDVSINRVFVLLIAGMVGVIFLALLGNELFKK